MRLVKVLVTAAIISALSLGTATPSSAQISDRAVSSKAGQFCKAADLGKKKIADNGKRIRCVKSGEHARWTKY